MKHMAIREVNLQLAAMQAVQGPLHCIQLLMHVNDGFVSLVSFSGTIQQLGLTAGALSLEIGSSSSSVSTVSAADRPRSP